MGINKAKWGIKLKVMVVHPSEKYFKVMVHANIL